jgi:hypothetical protein
MPSIATSNISNAASQTAKPTATVVQRVGGGGLLPHQIAMASQQAAMQTAVVAKDDAVRVTKQKRTEAIFATQKVKRDTDSERDGASDNQDEGESQDDTTPARRPLSLRV